LDFKKNAGKEEVYACDLCFAPWILEYVGWKLRKVFMYKCMHIYNDVTTEISK
jgi:hypothetical protein